MHKATTGYVAALCLLLALHPSGVRAQPTNPEDANINAIRTRDDIGTADQDRIARWIEKELEIFTDFPAFRRRLQEQYNDTDNTRAFRLQLALQTARTAATRLAQPSLDDEVAYSLAFVLVEMNRMDTFEGLLAGLESKHPRARLLCAKGLADLRTTIAADGARLDQVTTALRKAGLAETSPAVLARIYVALSYDQRVAEVIDIFLQLFDKRLERRRAMALVVDRAEVDAYEFFRLPAVLNALTPQQKAQSVGRLAAFMRLDAERYDTAELDYYESDNLERRLEGVEEILAALTGNQGGLREALKQAGHEGRATVRQEAYRWVGHPETKQAGVLNADPWDVPVGAP